MVLKFSFWPGAMAGGLCIPAMANHVPSWLVLAAGLTSQVSLPVQLAHISGLPFHPEQQEQQYSTTTLVTAIQQMYTVTSLHAQLGQPASKVNQKAIRQSEQYLDFAGCCDGMKADFG
jgi:hypothetical protein